MPRRSQQLPTVFRALLLAGMLMLVSGIVVLPVQAAEDDDSYDQETIINEASEFFGETTEGLAKAIEHVFEDQGQPNGFITGEEVSGAFVIGLRYGDGSLHRKNGDTRKVHWQGPSVGFDAGGNASKVN